MSNQLPLSKDDAKGFFGELFDFSFKSWVTLRVAGLLYGIILVIIGIIALVSMISLFGSGDIVTIFLALIGVPIVSLLAILFTRLAFESSIATIAIARNTEPKNSAQH